jgi:predicted nucleotidyltransferase
MLAQQASDYDVGGRNFHIQEKSMHENLEFSRAGIDELL